MFEKPSLSVQDTVAALYRLGHSPRREDWVEVMSTLGAHLILGGNAWLHQLLGTVRSLADKTAEHALDACIDLLCSEGRCEFGSHADEWRALAVGVLVTSPSRLDLVRLTDVSEIKQQIVAFTGLEPEQVFVDNHLMKSTLAVLAGPSSMYTWSSLLRSRAGGISLRFIEGLYPPYTSRQTEAPSTKPSVEVHEFIMGVALKTSGEDFTQALVNIGTRMASGARCGASSGDVNVQLTFADFGVPWSLSQQFVHTHEILQVASCLANAELKTEAVWVARLDDPLRSPHFRVGVTSPDGHLKAGFDFPNMAGENNFLMRLHSLCSATGKGYFMQTVQHTVDMVQSKGRALFPSSATGWSAASSE